MSKIFIVMPAYNEADNIEETIQQWYPIVEKLSLGGVDSKLIIANDGSKDNTFAIMKGLKGKYPLFEPLDKPNSGHGATVLYLYRYAIENSADYVFQTDSDGQTNPEEFWQMWDHRNEYDFQIGNRVERQDGGSRIFVAKTLRLIVWLIFHEWIKDANTPFRLMKANKLHKVLAVIPKDFFLCNVAISAIAKKWNYKIGWYNISFAPRRGGKNYINMRRILKIGLLALLELNRLSRKL